MKEPKWISNRVVLAIHGRLIAEHGGPSGLLTADSLQSALAAPRNRFLYEDADLFRIAASYASALTRDHPFRDGNKRVALTVAGVFLELNGYRLEASEDEAFAALLSLTTRDLDEEGFATWLRQSCSRVRAR